MSYYNLNDNLEDRKGYILSYNRIVSTVPTVQTSRRTENYIADECREMARDVRRKIPGYASLSVNNHSIEEKVQEIRENLEEVLNLSTEAIVILGEPFAYNSIQRTLDGLDDIYEIIGDAFLEYALIPAVNYCNERQTEANSAAYTNAVNARSSLGSNTSGATISEYVVDD